MIAPTYIPTITSQLGIGLSKTRHDLLERINTSLAKLMADRMVRGLFASYGITWIQPQ